MKNNKGITLIALVITIIVLLILAGVALAMLGGDNGILTKSRQAKADNQLGTAKDQIALACTEALHDYYEATYVSATTTQSYSKMGLINKLNAAIKATTIAPVTLKVEPTDLSAEPASDTVDAATFTLSYNERKVVGTIKGNGNLVWGNMEADS